MVKAVEPIAAPPPGGGSTTTCETCAFFDLLPPPSAREPATLGRCRAHAPVSAGLSQRGGMWPGVLATDWCGEYKVR
jgi:hypothetical protein